MTEDLEIHRALVDGAWVYADEHERIAALDWLLFFGFNLAAFDNFLTEPGWDSPAAQKNRSILFEQRSKALAAHAAGDRGEQEAWLNHLQGRLQMSTALTSVSDLSKKGVSYGGHQSVIASRDRPGHRNHEGVALRDFVMSFLKKPQNAEMTAKQLWTPLFHALMEDGFSPEEAGTPEKTRDLRFVFPFAPRSKTGEFPDLKFGTFQSWMTKARKKSS